ncbi:hypothetical protein M0Q97_02215 [Candidatus Dojkabacteria bacterium]|jgi:hypothetical protein|nr:hypothetical protein [Candidatus Dojkabacteria bacterium]
MTAENFVNILFEKVFDLKQAQVNAEESRDEIVGFLNSNTNYLNVSPSKVSKFLLQTCIELTNKNLPNQFIANVYRKDAIFFAILSCQFEMPLLKKFAKVFFETLKNTSHYTLEYKKPSKFARTIKVEPTQPLEFFWILPFFMSPKVIISTNLEGFILECIEITKALGDEFVDGYAYFAYQVQDIDKSNFKLFIHEASLSLK